MENKNCIVCGTGENLDTELVIVVDGEKVTIKVCTDHADNLTPKKAKTLYKKWKATQGDAIEALKAQAAKLGMTLVPQGSGLIIATANKPAHEQTRQPITESQVTSELHGGREDGVLSTSEVDNVMQHRVSGLGGAVGNANVERHSAYNPNDLASKLPEGARDGLVKMELAEGRHGTPLAVPAVRQDGLGTTRIKITKSMTDAELQRRFKQKASVSVADETGASAHYFKDGYDVHHCPMCKGDGQIPKTATESMICPKCGGSGML